MRFRAFTLQSFQHTASKAKHDTRCLSCTFELNLVSLLNKRCKFSSLKHIVRSMLRHFFLSLNKLKVSMAENKGASAVDRIHIEMKT